MLAPAAGLAYTNPMIHTKATITANLMTSAKWVERALLALYARQTADEQVMDATVTNNGMGFTGADAEYYSHLARFVAQSPRLPGQRLTDRQLAALRGYRNGVVVRRGITKYAAQLLKVAQAREVAQMSARAE